jgi:ketosteroid isomerase-like protein
MEKRQDGQSAIASAAFVPDGADPSTLTVNDPEIVREVAAEFAGYDKALRENDVAALNGYFFDSPTTTRFGNAENLYGYAEIAAYRAGAGGPGSGARRERTVITSFGKNFATVATLSRARPGKVGRTMQVWVRLPQGWRIVAAHVSAIDDPVT